MRITTSLLFLFSLFCAGASSAEISTLAGTGDKAFGGDGGPAAAAKLDNPFGVIVGPDGDIYFTDTGNHTVRKISRKTGVITTVAGTGGKSGYAGDGGPATEALCFEPYEVRFHRNGDLYWVEMKNNLVRRIDGRTGTIHTVAGTGEAGFSGDGGPAVKATMKAPHSIQFDASFEGLYVCDIGNHRIRRVDLADGTIDTWCGSGRAEATPDGAAISAKTPLKGPRALDIDPNGDFWLALREGNQVFRIDMKAKTLHHIAGSGEKGFDPTGPAKTARLSGPKGVAVSPDGKLIYLCDTESHTVRAIDLRNDPPTLDVVAGDGQKGNGPDSPDPLKCRMARPHGVGVDPVNGDLYIGDSESHKVRKVTGLPGAKPRTAATESKKESFDFQGYKAIVQTPAEPAPGHPWLWRCRFFGAFAQADDALVALGWHVANIETGETFGAPGALDVYDAFYDHLVKERRLSARPVMTGFSRGGLYAMNWAIRHPDRVAAIYLDAPVQDIHSWPQKTSPQLWEQAMKVYGLTESTASAWKGPLDGLAPLAAAKVPILSVCGGADKVVPFSENTAILEERYRKLGGPIDVVVKATCDHHPHSLHQPDLIVDWILAKAG